jgi:signal transduction histidine kinase
MPAAVPSMTLEWMPTTTPAPTAFSPSREATPGPRLGGPVQAVPALVGVGLFVVGTVMVGIGVAPFGAGPEDAGAAHRLWHLLPLAAACAAVTAGLSRPALAAGASTAAVLSSLPLGLHVAVLMPWSAAIYLVGRATGPRGRRRLGALLAGGCVAVGGWSLAGAGTAGGALLAVAQAAVFAAVPWWWSGEVRRRDQRLEAERRRDAARRVHAAHERREALRSERAALAAHLHDTVSSDLTTIALFSAAALDQDPEPERDRHVIREVRRSSLSALEDMRHLTEVLRAYEDEAPLAGRDRQRTLPEVVGRFRAAGLRIDVEGGRTPASVRTQGVLGRVAQEALTNAYKHGTGTAWLSLSADPAPADRTVRLVVENPVAGPLAHSGQPAAMSGGMGRDLMAAVVEDAGGAFTAGCLVRGRTPIWRVEAVLPDDPGDHGNPQEASG